MTYRGRVKNLSSLCDTKISIETSKKANIKENRVSRYLIVYYTRKLPTVGLIAA